ncbi:serine/threonine-protein kinase [Blastopirellula sp. JC732]|uniref:Serine/threonine-protein kinase n=1 Tax=Blastopirellula sediminis TaxID=2894196 RepID=A0A9X1SHJ1_9BACT|nr:serine/threonine-protein kinase [Blastopirellula sediminis]MCC9606209.1 serine/threonine-protein kinase [Blastopirellula sediminis]MCC9630493.1 serine/threonine-protein kinase [Blastopirellula sediminis]
MDDSDELRDPVEMLGEEFVQRLRSGEKPSINEYVAANPDHAEEIRSLFGTLMALEDLKSHHDEDRWQTPSGETSEEIPETIGDFRVLEMIGRGGMGVVYEAEQESLGRTVAIKVLIDHFSDSPQAVRRFRREAQAAARLQHPNIVAVFGVGQWERKHYYAMQYIAGRSLDRILAELNALRGTDSKGQDADDLGSATNVDDELAAEIAVALKQGRFEPSLAAKKVTAPPSVSKLSPTSPTVGAPSSPAAEVTSSALGETREVASVRLSRDYWRSVAGIGVQAANAMHYAHQQGVLHRDIKPGNLMLDNSGRAWLMDFGLAKLLDEADLTTPGDVVGTLRYMAPEQLEGRATTQTDIYSLGLTLYELLTLRPAFDRAEHYAALLKLKTSTTPPEPRSINPQIPADLQTIVLKAISPDPDHRYATAHEFEEDLQRYLDDVPIKARRTSSWEHLRRWCRRNPAMAALTTSTLLLLVISCFAAVFGYLRESHLRSSAETEKSRAEANLGLAAEAFDTIFRRISVQSPTRSLADSTNASELGETPTPRLSNNDVQILEGLLSFYDRFAEANGDSKRWQYESALAYRKVGEIQQRLGRAHRAQAAFERSIELLKQVPAIEVSSQTPPQLEMASIYQQLGDLAMAADQFDVAYQRFQEASEIIENGDAVWSETPEAQLQLAQAYSAMGKANIFGQVIPLSTTGAKVDADHARQLLSKSIEILERLVRDYPNTGDYRLELARSWEDYGGMMSFAANGRPSSDGVKQAIQLLEELVAEFPQEAEYRRALAWTYAHAAEFSSEELERDPLELLQTARELLVDMPPEYAEQPETREIAARISQHLAERKLDLRELDGLDELLEESQQTIIKLAEDFPYTKRYQFGLARNFYLQAIVAYERGDLNQASGDLEECIANCGLNSGGTIPAFLIHMAAKAQRGLKSIHTALGNNQRAEHAASEEAQLQRQLEQVELPLPPTPLTNDPWRIDRSALGETSSSKP